MEWESPRLSPGRPCFKITRWAYVPVVAYRLRVRRGHDSASIFLPQGNGELEPESFFMWLEWFGIAGLKKGSCSGTKLGCNQANGFLVSISVLLLACYLQPCCSLILLCLFNAAITWLLMVQMKFGCSAYRKSVFKMCKFVHCQDCES